MAALTIPAGDNDDEEGVRAPRCICFSPKEAMLASQRFGILTSMLCPS